MANKAILIDTIGKFYVCPYCTAVNSLEAMVDAVYTGVPIAPDDWPLGEGEVESSTILSVECIACGRVWDAEDGEVRFAPVKD